MSALDAIKNAMKKRQDDSATKAFAETSKDTQIEIDFKEYKTLINHKFKKEQFLDIQIYYYKNSQKFQFVFYDNDIRNAKEYINLSDLNEMFINKFLKVNKKKQDQYEKKKWNFNPIEHLIFNSFNFTQVLSAYMIEKNSEGEKKDDFVDNFNLNFTELMNDDIFMKYCEKFNEENRGDYFDLLN